MTLRVAVTVAPSAVPLYRPPPCTVMPGLLPTALLRLTTLSTRVRLGGGPPGRSFQTPPPVANPEGPPALEVLSSTATLRRLRLPAFAMPPPSPPAVPEVVFAAV